MLKINNKNIRLISYHRNQLIDLYCKSFGWFPYDKFFLMFLLLTLNIFHTFFSISICWITDRRFCVEVSLIIPVIGTMFKENTY